MALQSTPVTHPATKRRHGDGIDDVSCRQVFDSAVAPAVHSGLSYGCLASKHRRAVAGIVDIQRRVEAIEARRDAAVASLAAQLNEFDHEPLPAEPAFQHLKDCVLASEAASFAYVLETRMGLSLLHAAFSVGTSDTLKRRTLAVITKAAAIAASKQTPPTPEMARIVAVAEAAAAVNAVLRAASKNAASPVQPQHLSALASHAKQFGERSKRCPWARHISKEAFVLATTPQ